MSNEKAKKVYRYIRSTGPVLKARREISYEIKLSSRILLDELCFKWNKKLLLSRIDQAIDTRDKELFLKLSAQYQVYIE